MSAQPLPKRGLNILEYTLQPQDKPPMLLKFVYVVLFNDSIDIRFEGTGP